MSQSEYRHFYTQSALLIGLIVSSLILFLLFNVPNLSAQEITDQSSTVQPTEATAPTLEDTAVTVLTHVPTIEPTSVVPTEVTIQTGSDSPTQVTETLTQGLTQVSEITVPAISNPMDVPPVFNFMYGTAFDNVGGEPITFQFYVSDDRGAVSTTAHTANGVVTVTTTPLETAAPFNMLVNITYTASANFSGLDTVTLVAIDMEGQKTSAALTVNVIAPQLATEHPTEMPAATKEMLITYNPTASEEAIQAMLTRLGAVELNRIPQIGAMRVLLPEIMAMPSTAMTTLQSSGTAMLAGVSSVEANGEYTLFVTPYTPNDPGFSSQWGLRQGPGGIFAEYAWNIASTRGFGVTVAVIDSGVDLQHPDLVDQLVPGWDFVNGDSIPNDDTVSGHGTHVSGIIAARTANGTGVAGVAFNAKIMPLKVCGALGTCNTYYIAAAIVHAADSGAQVINLSLGSTTPSSVIEAAVNYALSRNVVVVAAAGNIGGSLADGTFVYPASYQGVISVAAYDSTGTRAAFSNSNSQVDISAPGVGIYSLLPIARGSYGTLSGTSMASPYVAGVAALIIGARVAATPPTVQDALKCGAYPAGDTTKYGQGRLQADVSLNWKRNSGSCKITLTNDSFQAPITISAVPYAIIQPIHSRTATTQASDPSPICDAVASSQTVWYTFRPTVSGPYQFSTLGSSYNTVFGVYHGAAGQLTRVGCSTALQKSFSLQAGQTYHIVLGTNGVAVDDQVLHLRINPGLMANNVLYQENATGIAYSGMWMRNVITGSSGTYTQQTTDIEAVAAFSFRGVSFDYIRTMGPAQGQSLIYLNNDPSPILIDNRGAVTQANQAKTILIPNSRVGQWNTVRIMRDPSIPGTIDLDAVKTYDFDNNVVLTPITTKVDDRMMQLSYTTGSSRGWTDVADTTTTAYLGTLKQTDDPTATMTFRILGNAVTLFRMTGPNFAPIQVVINDGVPVTVDNRAASNAVRPYTINGLVAMTHVVQISKVGPMGDGLMIQLDAVQGITLTQLIPGNTYDDRAISALAYRGGWTDTAAASAYGMTTRTLTANSEVSFELAGNDLCVGYQQPTGALDVYIDETWISTIPASVGLGFGRWCLDGNASKLVPDGTHYARLVVPANSMFTLDYVKPQRYNMLTPIRGLVPETDLSFRYTTPTDWITLTAKASDGYAPQGGYVRASSMDNTTITFYINGSGFILYTRAGPEQGCWEILVDGAVYQPSKGVNGIDMFDPWRDRPIGYGVSVLPGIHKIVLRVDANCSSLGFNTSSAFILNFDGIRVFP